MPLDFPANPVNGQIFAPGGGMSWQFDGTKWVPAAGQSAFPDAPSDGNTYGRRNAAWNSVDAMLAPVSANANGALNNVGRNLVHNGQFNVHQRVSPYTAVVGSLVYTFDRWYVYANVSGDSATVTLTPVGDAGRVAIGDDAADVFTSIAFIGGSGSTNNVQFGQRIEAVRRLANKTVTVSFYAYASAALRLGVAFNQNFGSGGSPSATVLGNGQSVLLTTGWARYSLTFAIPSISGMTIGTNINTDYTDMVFWLSAGSGFGARPGGVPVQSGTINIWGVQLEIGSQATPLAKRDPADDLALCQRFAWVNTANIQVYGYGGGANNAGVHVSYPVQMRAVPTVGSAWSGGVNLGNNGVQNIGTLGFDLFIVATAAGAYAAAWNSGNVVSADL